MNAQHLRDAPGDVDAAGKVAVELNAIEAHGQGGHGAAVTGRVVENGIDCHGRPVCNDQLFQISPHGQLNPVFQIVRIKGVLGGQLVAQLTVAADGSLDHLREKGGEQRKLCHVSLGRVFSPIAIDDIADALKHIKGQAQRHQQVQSGKLEPAPGKAGHGVCCKVPVFDHIKQSEVGHGDQRDNQLLTPFQGVGSRTRLRRHGLPPEVELPQPETGSIGG